MQRLLTMKNTKFVKVNPYCLTALGTKLEALCFFMIFMTFVSFMVDSRVWRARTSFRLGVSNLIASFTEDLKCQPIAKPDTLVGGSTPVEDRR